MGWFVVRRLLAAVGLMVLVPSLSFAFLTVTYVDGPLFPDLPDYMWQTFLRFDLGDRASGSVAAFLRESMPVDVAILLGALVLGVGGGVLAGAAVARRPRSATSRLLYGLNPVALSAPAYLVAFAVVYAFGSGGGEWPLPFVTDLQVYRPLSQDPLAWLHAMWVPWVVVALPLFAGVMRLSASATRDAISGDEMRTALAKGLGERRAVRRHALPMSVPVVGAYAGASLNLMILNVAVVERLFNLPGSFRIALRGLDNVDFLDIQTVVLVTVLYVVVGNLIADVVLARVDPRVRPA